MSVAPGLPLEDRAARPHVTIRRGDRTLAFEIASLGRVACPRPITLTSDDSMVDLMRYDLTAGGARRERVTAALLGGE